MFLLLIILCSLANVAQLIEPTGIEANYSTQLEIANNFVESLNLYLRDQHYSQYRHLLESIEPNLVRTDQDRQCLRLLNFSLLNPVQHKWTSKLLDSSGPLFSPGLFSGTYTSFGDYDSCLAIDAEHYTIKVLGKHCFVTVRLPVNATRFIDYRYSSLTSESNQSWTSSLVKRWTELDVSFPVAHSLCVPSVCSSSFIREVILDAFKPLKSLDVNVKYCQTQANVSQKLTNWSFALIFVCSVLGVMALFIVFGTLLDVFWHRKDPENQTLALKVLTCFSVVSNGRELFSLQRTSKYEWIDGIRCLLTTLAIFGHLSASQTVLQFIGLSPFAHFPDDLVRQSSSLVNRYLVNGTFEIKIFFMISGFLLSVNFLKKSKLHSFPRYLLTRWLRFTPSLIGYVTICLGLSLVGNGPLFHSSLIEPYVRPCVENLWMQLLYINNWFDFRLSCGFQTWYISADLQLHLLAYIVLLLLHRQKWLLSYLTSLFFIVLSYLISFVIFSTGIQGIPYFMSVIYPQLPVPDRGYLVYWTSTYNHLEAYFLGILLGIVIAKRITLIKLSDSSVRIIFNTALIVIPIVPQAFPWFLKSDQDKYLLDLVDSHSWFDAFIMTTFHASMMLIFATIFYLASMHSAQLKSHPAIQFLSSPMFVPLSRLCFCMYLVHVPLTWFIVHSGRMPQMRDEFGATQFVILTYVNSIFVAVLLHLFFEAPFTKLSQLLFFWYDRKLKVKTVKSTGDQPIVLTTTKLTDKDEHIHESNCELQSITTTNLFIHTETFNRQVEDHPNRIDENNNV